MLRIYSSLHLKANEREIKCKCDCHSGRSQISLLVLEINLYHTNFLIKFC